jgi:hypothetical protein
VESCVDEELRGEGLGWVRMGCGGKDVLGEKDVYGPRPGRMEVYIISV